MDGFEQIRMKPVLIVLFSVAVLFTVFHQTVARDEGSPPPDQVVIRLSRLDALINEIGMMSGPEEIRSALQKFRAELLDPTELELPDQSWSGKWNTTYGEMTLELDKFGEFTGNYGPSQHKLRGTFYPERPHELSGYWKHTTSDWTGRFRFVFTKQDSFEGTWTSGNAEPNLQQVNWTGTRRKVSPP